jgi:hypothetical protein
MVAPGGVLLIACERMIDRPPSRFHYLSVGGGDPFLLLL